MAILSLEQRRQRERADEQANKIRQELAECDLAHSRDPIDRRRAEKEAERKAIATREVEQSQRTTNWMRWIDQRIEQHLRKYFCSGDEEHPGILTEAIGEVMALNRKRAEAEVKKQIEAERQAVDAKLEALEQASNDRWVVIDQRIERERESVFQETGDVLGQFRAELKVFKPTLEEKERLFDAKLAALEERLKSVPGKLPVAKTWQPETVVYQAEMISHNGSLWQAKRDTSLRAMAATRSRRPCAASSIRTKLMRSSTSSSLKALRTSQNTTIPASPATTMDGKC